MNWCIDWRECRDVIVVVVVGDSCSWDCGWRGCVGAYPDSGWVGMMAAKRCSRTETLREI